MFITFEGLDCSGKTTQANLLVARLTKSGKSVLCLREPGGTPISEKIRTILLDNKHGEMNQKTELLLFSAARAQLVKQVIRPALDKNTIVICDRFFDSTSAYQGYGRGLDLNVVQLINTTAVDGTMPDMTVFIDIEVDEILRRRTTAGLSTDRMESSGKEFYERVRKGFLEIAKAESKRCVIINGMKQKEEIHNFIWDLIQQRIT